MGRLIIFTGGEQYEYSMKVLIIIWSEDLTTFEQRGFVNDLKNPSIFADCDYVIIASPDYWRS